MPAQRLSFKINGSTRISIPENLGIRKQVGFLGGARNKKRGRSLKDRSLVITKQIRHKDQQQQQL